MAHYAFIKDNIVTEVITGKDETETTPDGFTDWEEYYLSKRADQDACKRTSYNTSRKQHLLGDTPFRGNYAGIGDTYDSTKDIFIKPKPFDSAVFDDDVADWDYPIPMPSDNNQDGSDKTKPKKFYMWNDDAYKKDNTKGWDLSYTASYDTSSKEWVIDE